MQTQLRPVAIFWDFGGCKILALRLPNAYEICIENCSLGRDAGVCGTENIRRIAQEYGPIKVFKAYLDISEQCSAKATLLRSELQSCGVSLTDCPHVGKKDVADKMILGVYVLCFVTLDNLRGAHLADMFAFALDTDTPATIVLLSGDRDFAYAASILRMRGYHIVTIAPKQSHANFKHRASEVLDWDALIACRQGTPHTSSRCASDSACLRPDFSTLYERRYVSPPPHPPKSHCPSVMEEGLLGIPRSPQVDTQSGEQVPTNSSDKPPPNLDRGAPGNTSEPPNPPVPPTSLESAVEDEDILSLASAFDTRIGNKTLPSVKPSVISVDVCSIYHILID